MGLWDKAYSSADIPTMREVEKVYRPGNMPFLRYFQNGFSKQQGIYIINNQKTILRKRTTLSHLIRRIDPQRASRVFLVENEIDLEKIAAAAKSLNIYPVMMEALR